MSEAWSSQEVEAAVAAYLDLLRKELRGDDINKTAANLQLRAQLKNRSKGSIEFKHQNISAILIELGYPYVDGYKPRRNYQGLLRDIVEQKLLNDDQLRLEVQKAVESPLVKPHLELPPNRDILKTREDAPEPSEDDYQLSEKRRAPTKPIPRQVNYLEIETRNRQLGLAGEQFVLLYEHERLWRAGQRHLADRIEHVSKTQGDGLGYDIHSFDVTGRDLLIEVKTTQFPKMTPFYASRNELRISEDQSQAYQLYRVFNFRKDPKFFVLPGSLRSTCHCEPETFVLKPR